MPIIGQISLNISFLIYLIWFVPQITLNFKRKNTEGLSLFMHGLLCIGYLSDLMYGFGRDMQWQYRTITLIGLFSLAIQHYQFFRYGLHNAKKKWTFAGLSILYSLLLCCVILNLQLYHSEQSFYDAAGMIANICWLSYMLPQIIENYCSRSTTGLSMLFVLFAVFLNVCDLTSAWMLDWDYPSKIGPAVTLIGNLILIFQIVYYAEKDESMEQLAADR